MLRRLYRIGISLLVVMAMVAMASSSAEPLPLPPPLPAAAGELLHARPFRSLAGYRPFPDAAPTFTRGYLVVLQVDPRLVLPTEESEFVLLAGESLVHRLNVGHPSGTVIGIVPGDRDLHGTLIWFGEGSDALGHREVLASRGRAAAAGLQPFPDERVDAALASGGEPLLVRDPAELFHHAGLLVLRYAPDERDLAQALMGRPPVAPAPSRPETPARRGESRPAMRLR